MRKFTDRLGRDWPFEITVAAVKRVRAMAGVDLFGLVGESGFDGLAALVADPIALVDVLYVLCKPEADARGISDEEFGRGMGGDCIEAAANAFVLELADFFPSPRVRAALRKLGEAWGPTEARINRIAIEQIEAIDLEAEVEKALASSGLSTSSPASSASTPAPSPSASST